MAAPQLRVTVPPELAAAGGTSSPEARVAASLAAGQRTLPRASMVVHGGDLCYPSPTGGLGSAGQLGHAVHGAAWLGHCVWREDDSLCHASQEPASGHVAAALVVSTRLHRLCPPARRHAPTRR